MVFQAGAGAAVETAAVPERAMPEPVVRETQLPGLVMGAAAGVAVQLPRQVER
jgi:hypothetical protein